MTFRYLLATVILAGIANFAFGADFQLNKCTGLASNVKQAVLHQDEVVDMFCDELCGHLQNPTPGTPLVLLLNGGTGLGKTLTYQIAMDILLGRNCYPKHSLHLENLREFQTWARRVWNSVRHASGIVFNGLTGQGFNEVQQDATACVTKNAPFLSFHSGDKTLTASDAALQVQDQVLKRPNSILVFEEWDSFACDIRRFIKDIVSSGQVNGVGMTRATVILLTNEATEVINAAIHNNKGADRNTISRLAGSEVGKAISHHVEKTMTTCGSADEKAKTDATKMVSNINAFLPYLPIGKADMHDVINQVLRGFCKNYREQGIGKIVWTEKVVVRVLSKIPDYMWDGDGPDQQLVYGARKAAHITHSTVRVPMVNFAKKSKTTRATGNYQMDVNAGDTLIFTKLSPTSDVYKGARSCLDDPNSVHTDL